MGGDNAPGEIVTGALEAVDELRVGVAARRDRGEFRDHVPNGAPPDGVEIIGCREVIAMDDEPAAAVRKKKDARSVVRPRGGA